MSWLALVIIGAIVWLVGQYAPLPVPLPVMLRIIGAVLFVVGILFLVLGLIGALPVYAHSP